MNVVQAGIMELANDEAYCWSWVCADGGKLDWGYFDHPPMVALLIWLTSWLSGELGVRLATTLLLPVSLYLFWVMVRPQSATYHDVLLYVLLCFSMPSLQLYGILALPDASLLFASVVYLFAFQRYCNSNNVGNALLLVLAIALLGYCKYHGLLLVVFTVLSCPSLLKRKTFYLTVVGSLLLYLPHLYWQYEHEWVSLKYHLLQRHNGFDFGNVIHYLCDLLLFFNPLLLVFFGKALHRAVSTRHTDKDSKPMLYAVTGCMLFFLAVSFRGSTQAHWMLIATYALLWLTFKYIWCENNSIKWLQRLATISAVFFLLLRIVFIVNPFNMQGELWNNEASYKKIATVANGRPVEFDQYAMAAKYVFYTRQQAHCTAEYYYRQSQWKYNQCDRSFDSKETLVQTHRYYATDTILLPNNKIFSYCCVSSFRPIRELSISIDKSLKQLHAVGDSVTVDLYVKNPYPYDLMSTSADSLYLGMYCHYMPRCVPYVSIPLYVTLKANSITKLSCRLPMIKNLDKGDYPVGFFVRRRDYNPSCQCKLAATIHID